ncbi:proline-rich protein 36-like isoform X1 [Carassius auratus]|uniref:Proline-rich protein 36-like isoform X1 n=1 Tax=Carassius auratus TaxID=7957 RepID=A0A6P6M8N2_CARAU|nr:proline-rich protein 36-like isoform X1 [Carassius auratus]
MDPVDQLLHLRKGGLSIEEYVHRFCHPLMVVNGQDLPQDSQPPAAPSLEDPRSSSLAFKTWAPLRSVDPLVSPWLKALSSPLWPISQLAPPGFLVPPAPPWSFVNLPSPQDYNPLALPRLSIPLAPLGSSLPPAPTWSLVALAPPWPSGTPPSPRSPESSAPPWPSDPSVLLWLFGSPSSPWAPRPPALFLSVRPLKPSVSLPSWVLPPTPSWTVSSSRNWSIWNLLFGRGLGHDKGFGLCSLGLHFP